MRKNERGLSMNRAPSPRPSPPRGERVSEGRVRGISTGSWSLCMPKNERGALHPPGFGLRQSSGAFRSGLGAQKRQGTAALQDAIATAHTPPRFMVMPAAKRNRALHEPAEAPPGLGLRQPSGAFRSGLAA